METHAGLGFIFERCWSGSICGIAIDKDKGRTEVLARQRPTWSVYRADATKALAGGLGSHLTIDVLDVDPYGDPWPTTLAFFASARTFAQTMHVVVNDGLRNKVRMGGAWHVGALRSIVERHGNDVFPKYLEVCRELMGAAVEPAGYTVSSFRGYYCGHNGDMTHYWATLTR